MSQSKNILLSKLDEFIRKYYKNQLLRGLLYSVALIITSFLFVVVTEYFVQFETTTRTLLFYTFVFTGIYIVSKYIVIPVLKLNKLTHTLSYEEAADIVGKHFVSINDKLINTLQLQKNINSIFSSELLIASINQKTKELNPIPFSSAINFNENKKYLKYAVPPLILFILIFSINPSIIKDGTERLIYHQTTFEKLAPFQFSVLNKNLVAVQQQDFKIQLTLQGNEIPNEVFITVDGIEHKMEKINNLNFAYTFKNIQNTSQFIFNAAGFTSKAYEIIVLPKPLLVKFNAQLIYPIYLNKKNENIINLGDMQVPLGTKIKWTFFTKNAENVLIRFQDSTIQSSKDDYNEFSFSKQMMQSSYYSIKVGNNFLKQNSDSINYTLNVIPDQLPVIQVSEKQDSLNPQNIYFSGTIKDDYGFTRLVFKYTQWVKDSLGKINSKQAELPIEINKQNIAQGYFYFLNASQFNLKPGDKIEYYFEVWDNDGIHGPKSAKTQTMFYKAPSIDDINKATEKNNSEIKKDINDEIKKAKELQKDIADFSKKLTEKKTMAYEKKKKLEDILKKQNELKNKIEQTKQENQLNNKQQEELTKNDETLLEKQKQLEQLFENIMTPEMKKLFDELNKMLDKLDKNQVQEKLEELKFTNKDMEKELDRTLEAFKQMEVEQKMQQAIDKLDDIKNQQNQLKKDTEELSKPNEKQSPENKQELEKKQDELNKKFDDLKKDIKDLEQKNEALEQKNEIPKTEQKQNEISKDMKKSSEELSKKNKKEAAKSQKDAADEMQEMQNQMQQSMDEMEKEEQEEDMQALRQILENLLNLSFGQEDLMITLSKLKAENPQYLAIPKKQRKLQDDSKIIEDSLFALSKRNPAISATVNREISSIIMNMKKTINSLEERLLPDAQVRMQYSMTSINNLALLLNESLEQMQQKAKEGKKEGSGKCKKPGKGAKPSSGSGNKPSMQSMKQMQEQLNKQLQELKKALEKGQKPGGEKPGDKPGQKPGGSKPGGAQGGNGSQGQQGSQGMPGLSQQLAKAAAQQEALRRQMQQMLDKIKKEGGNNSGGNIAEMMEQTEKDIVNKQISQETMRRQQDIITKLLESEKAEREREQDEQRKSNEAKNQNLSNPTQFLEYKRLKEKELELLNTVAPSLTPYFKEKVTNYFNNVNK